MLQDKETDVIIPEDSPEERVVQLPLSKIRNLMKLQNSAGIISQDSVVALAKATEFFIESLTKLSYNEVVVTSKKKTVQKRDVERVIQSTDALCFLEDSMLVFDTIQK